jgi:uncharacterized membrane protein
VDALSALGNTRMLSAARSQNPAMPAAATVSRLKILFALAYPFVAHFAVIRNSMALIVVAVALLIAVAILPALLRGSAAAWITVPIVGAVLWWLSGSTHSTLPLYIAPVLVPGFMAGVFGSSLLKGQTPVIEQLIGLMHQPTDEPPEPAVWAYARALTLAWTLLFVVISATNLTLALLAEPNGILLASGIAPPFTVPLEGWSWFANGIDYVLVAALFLIEYAYRRHRFPRQPYRNLLDFFQRVLAAMPRLVGNVADNRR